jgi:cyclomaltodextrinase
MINYNSRKSFYKSPFGAVEENTDLLFRIKVSGSGSAASAQLLFSLEQFDLQEKVEGVLEQTAETEQTFRFVWQPKQIGLYFYCFEVTWQDGSIERSPDYQVTVYQKDFSVPGWLKSGIMYQIFPDRFARSSKYTAPGQEKDYVLRDDWGGKPNDQPDEKGVIRNNDFFGGNLRGIIEKLLYLEELGVTVIYLNPIFEAYSNHRYDTGDYKKIDPMLGTEEDFRELCEKAKERGIRIILDGVFNHTGSDSLYFNKSGRYPGQGAYQSKDSPYYGWYRFIEYPEKYESWWGIDTLPGINETEPSYLDYIARAEDSVIKHWLRCGASGYRLDVADELPDEFLESVRSAIKEIKPDSAVIGEVWEDASNKVSYGRRRRYLLGRQLDTVMNYPLKNAIIEYLVYRNDGLALEQIVNSLWENYPKPAFNTLMNILGTHDTARIFTVMSENSKDDNYARQRLFLAMLILSFMPGIPCVYYGDEIGMRGGQDPINRMCFQPEHGDPYILRYFKRLFKFRNRIDGLGEFSFHPRSAEGGFYSFSRIGENDRLIIAVNAGNQDYLLNLAMKEKEILKDFFISGSVSFERQGVFRIKENSGIVAHIQCTELNTM